MHTRHGARQVTRAQAIALKSTGSSRRGVASLLAMLYLVVFAALALGFYAQTNTSVQVSNNERRTKEALMAAEAGLQYIRYELSRVTIPMMAPPMPQLTDDQVFEEVQMDLKSSIESGGNLEGGGTVGDIVYDTNPVDGISPPRFEIPADPKQYIRLTGAGPWFRVRLEQSGRDLVVTTVGKSGSISSSAAGARGIQVRFNAKEWPNTVFDYGIASQNAINITVAKMMVQGTPATQASILSTYTGGVPVTIGNTSSTVAEPTGISGDIALMQGAANPTYVGSNYSVDGLKTSAAINSDIERITEPPEWPTPDVTIYSKYATNKFVPGPGEHVNIYIDSGTTYTFDSTHTLKGVVYIKAGCNITFNGQVKMQCVVVGEPAGSIATNLIKFQGNSVAKLPLSSLPADDPRFTELRTLDGTFVLAPKWDVSFTGNFVSAAGSIAADKITFSGNTTGTVTGSLVSLGNYPLNITGSTQLTLADPATDAHPGLRFSERFVSKKGSYKEVAAAN